MASLTVSTIEMSTTQATNKAASWLTMAPNRWPEPELSIGMPHGSLGRWDKLNCWTVRENSPAHFMWKGPEGLSAKIFNLLDEHIQHLDGQGSEILFQLFMVGRQPTKSSPTVVFCSKNKAFRKKAMDLIVKKMLLETHPGVLAAHSISMPQPLAIGDTLQAGDLSEGVYAEAPLISCGVSIYIVSNDSMLRRATIGGFLSIAGGYYGLTTAHAFAEANPVSSKEGSDSESDFGFSSVLGEPEDAPDNEDYLLEVTSKGEMPIPLCDDLLLYRINSSIESVSSSSSDAYSSSAISRPDLEQDSSAITPNIVSSLPEQVEKYRSTENLQLSGQSAVSLV